MRITYEDKQYVNEQPDIPNMNKVTDNDMNEIKNVINSNLDNYLEMLFGGELITWISGNSYVVGDIVVYNNLIYKCKEDTSDTTFDPTKWEQIPLFVLK